MLNPDQDPKVIFGIFLLSSQNKNDSDSFDTNDRKKKFHTQFESEKT